MIQFREVLSTVWILAAIYFTPCTAFLGNVEYIYEWGVLPFAVPPGTQLDPRYQLNDTYLSGITDTRDRFILCTPRTLSWLPATLSYIPKSETSMSPAVQPYPDISWQRMPANAEDCNTTLVSVFRTARDPCNRLWVLDTGVYNNSAVQDPGVKLCPPKIVIFDLNLNLMVRVIGIDESVLTNRSLVANLVLDYDFLAPELNNNCDDVFVYIADPITPRLIVMESPVDNFYWFTHPTMYPVPDFGTFDIEGVVFTNMYGISGLAVTNSEGGRNELYYSVFAGRSIYRFSREDLRGGPFNEDPSQLNISQVLRESSQSLALCTDASNGNLIFNPIYQNAIVSANPATRRQMLLALSRPLIKVIHDCSQDISNLNILYFSSNSLERYFVGTVSARQRNLGILRLTKTVYG